MREGLNPVSSMRRRPDPIQSASRTVCFHQGDCEFRRRDAMNATPGDADLSLDSIEGHVANAVYGKQVGESVLRRISTIACILIWARICRLTLMTRFFLTISGDTLSVYQYLSAYTSL